MKVVTEEAVRMSDGKLFHAVGLVAETSSGTRDAKVAEGWTVVPEAKSGVSGGG